MSGADEGIGFALRALLQDVAPEGPSVDPLSNQTHKNKLFQHTQENKNEQRERFLTKVYCFDLEFGFAVSGLFRRESHLTLEPRETYNMSLKH